MYIYILCVQIMVVKIFYSMMGKRVPRMIGGRTSWIRCFSHYLCWSVATLGFTLCLAGCKKQYLADVQCPVNFSTKCRFWTWPEDVSVGVHIPTLVGWCCMKLYTLIIFFFYINPLYGWRITENTNLSCTKVYPVYPEAKERLKLRLSMLRSLA